MDNQDEKNLDLLANLYLVLGILTILNLNKDTTKELFIS